MVCAQKRVLTTNRGHWTPGAKVRGGHDGSGVVQVAAGTCRETPSRVSPAKERGSLLFHLHF